MHPARGSASPPPRVALYNDAHRGPRLHVRPRQIGAPRVDGPQPRPSGCSRGSGTSSCGSTPPSPPTATSVRSAPCTASRSVAAATRRGSVDLQAGVSYPTGVEINQCSGAR